MELSAIEFTRIDVIADEAMLAWQGVPSWDGAVREYLADGTYVTISDDDALRPRPLTAPARGGKEDGARRLSSVGRASHS